MYSPKDQVRCFLFEYAVGAYSKEFFSRMPINDAADVFCEGDDYDV